MRVFIIFYFLTFTHLLSAQSKSDSLIKIYLANAKEQIALNNYNAANSQIKKIFGLKGVRLPDETAYYFGLIQIKQNNYAKGKEALEKYISLTGEQGEFYKEARELLSEAEIHICKKCNNTGSREVIDTCTVCLGEGKHKVYCDACRSQGIEYCAACRGKGVYVSGGGFGNIYSTCQKCNGKGYSECHVCKGTKEKLILCNDCKGKGFFKRKINCDH